MPKCLDKISDKDFNELLRIIRTYKAEQLAEAIYYACDENKKTVALVNEINLYMVGIKKVK